MLIYIFPLWDIIVNHEIPRYVERNFKIIETCIIYHLVHIISWVVASLKLKEIQFLLFKRGVKIQQFYRIYFRTLPDLVRSKIRF